MDANDVLLNSQSEFRLVQSLDFCYLCGRDFASGEAKSRDHVPPTAIFAVEDREPALILPTHVSCNQSRSIEDQVSAQLVGLKNGRNEDRKHNKLDVVFGQFQDGTPFAGVRNLNVRSMIKRWVTAFHAALYREPLPQGVHWSTLPPLPQAKIENEGLNEIPIPQVMLKFVELLKRNRLTGSLDRIVCRNGKSVYECVWTQFHNGKWFCAFCLSLYDWVSLGDDTSFVRRGCVGSYVMAQIGIPRGATSATNLVLDIKNDFPWIHSKNSRPKKSCSRQAVRDGDAQSKQFVCAACG